MNVCSLSYTSSKGKHLLPHALFTTHLLANFQGNLYHPEARLTHVPTIDVVGYQHPGFGAWTDSGRTVLFGSQGNGPQYYTVTRSAVSHPRRLLWTGLSENDKSRLRPRSKI